MTDDLSTPMAAHPMPTMSDALYREILDSAVDTAVVSTDRQGNVRTWSRGAQQITGWSAAEMVGRPLATIFTPEDREAGRPAMEMRAADQTGRANDMRWHLRKDGRRFYAHGSISPLQPPLHGYVKSFRDATVQHQAETALREASELAHQRSDERYRSLFNSIDAAFCVIDMVYDADGRAVDYRFVEVNPAFAANTGLRGVAGRTIRELVPSIEQFWIDIYAEVAASGTAKRFENHAKALENRWYTVVAFRIENPDLRRVAVLFNDITEKHRVEYNLRVSEARLANALSISALGTFEWSADTDLFELSARGRQIFGFEPDDETASLTARSRIHPQDIARVRQELFGVLDQGVPRICEFRVLLPDRSVRYVKSLSDSTIHDGSAARLAGVLEDVTERTQELQQSQSRFQAYFDASPEYLYLLRLSDADRLLFEDVNPAGAQLYGLSRAAMIGRSAADILPSDCTTDDIELNARRALEEGRTLRYEASLHYGSRGLVTTNTIVAPLEIGTDKRGVVLVCKRDMTEQRHAEEQLRQSQKMEAIGQLTAGIAHDFNNLLAGVMGSLELMQHRIKQGRGNEIDRYIATAQESSKRAADLTQRLLAFSRRQTLSPQPTDVNRFLKSLEALVRTTIGPSIHLDIVETDALWMTEVDRNQLQIALVNLCINSCDAMPNGGRLTIETANFVVDHGMAHDGDLTMGDYVSLSISDTGIGMTPAATARAFDPFFTTKPLGNGTGLGLSMVYGFAKQSGGHVRLYSEVDRGATVSIYLPRLMPKVESVSRQVAATKPHAPTTAARSVLIVDDEAMVRMLVLEVVGDCGHATLEAEDGASALAILRSGAQVDLLVTDVGMPNMNGRQLADQARALRPDLKVLFLTGYAENTVIDQGQLDCGFQIMTKPFMIGALSNKLREMLG